MRNARPDYTRRSDTVYFEAGPLRRADGGLNSKLLRALGVADASLTRIRFRGAAERRVALISTAAQAEGRQRPPDADDLVGVTLLRAAHILVQPRFWLELVTAAKASAFRTMAGSSDSSAIG